MTPTSRVSEAMFDAAKKVIVEDDCFYVTDAAIRLALEAALSTTDDAVAVGEVLDEPAKVGCVEFGKGVAWSSVVACAQRAYKHKDDPKPTPEQIADLSAILNRGGK